MDVCGIEVEVIKKEIRNMHLYVLPPSGKVRVSAPLGVSEKTIRLFVASRLPWIKKQISRLENRPTQPESEYVSGETHYLWGQGYCLEVRHSNAAGRIETGDGSLILAVRENSTAGQRENVLNAWYRKQIKAKVRELIEKWEPVIGVKVSEFGVKNMKTRWGTCNTGARRIWLNLQLAKKPLCCLEYVVVHELAHLIVRDHGPAFAALMDRHLPDWRRIRAGLNDSTGFLNGGSSK